MENPEKKPQTPRVKISITPPPTAYQNQLLEFFSPSPTLHKIPILPFRFPASTFSKKNKDELECLWAALEEAFERLGQLETQTGLKDVKGQASGLGRHFCDGCEL